MEFSPPSTHSGNMLFLVSMICSSSGLNITCLRNIVLLSLRMSGSSVLWFLVLIIIRNLVIRRPYFFFELPLGKEFGHVWDQVMFDTTFVNHSWNWNGPLVRLVTTSFKWLLRLTQGRSWGHWECSPGRNPVCDYGWIWAMSILIFVHRNLQACKQNSLCSL